MSSSVADPLPPMSNAEHIAGVVARLPEGKGFFFIRDAEGRDYFAHGSELKNTTLYKLRVGDELSFFPTESAKGFRAVDITLTRSNPVGH